MAVTAKKLAAQHDLFVQRLPRYPQATDNLRWGIRRFPREVAVRKAYIQPNPPLLTQWLIFDVDRPDAALRWEDVGLPAPTWVARNPANGHAHLAYGLQVPVPRCEAARLAPIRLADAIQRAFTAELEADFRYKGLIAKNPLHPAWEVLWHCRDEHDLYALHDLAAYVDLRQEVPRARQGAGYGISRNCTLFDTLRHWAYKAVRECWRPGGFADWQARTIARARAHNRFSDPLPDNEVRAIARSVAKWVWQRFTPAEFRARQGKRGRRKGEAVRVAMLPVVQQLRAEGLSLRAVAAEVGVSYQTVSDWLKRDDTRQPETPAERRLHAQRLHREGATVEQIAMVLGVSVRQAYRLLSGRGTDICQEAISDNRPLAGGGG